MYVRYSRNAIRNWGKHAILIAPTQHGEVSWCCFFSFPFSFKFHLITHSIHTFCKPMMWPSLALRILSFVIMVIQHTNVIFPYSLHGFSSPQESINPSKGKVYILITLSMESSTMCSKTTGSKNLLTA